jgi:protein SCO1
MARTPRLAILAILCLAIAAGVATAVIWRNRQAHSTLSLATGTYLVSARRLEPFKLVDHHGQDFTNQNLAGHWSILYFGFTHCPDLCPTTLATLAKVVKSLRAKGAPSIPRVVLVTVDPGRDTQEALARYVAAFDNEFIGVTADSPAAIEKFTRQMGVAVAIDRPAGGDYRVDHSGALFIISPDGALRAVLTGPMEVKPLAADLLQLVAAVS